MAALDLITKEGPSQIENSPVHAAQPGNTAKQPPEWPPPSQQQEQQQQEQQQQEQQQQEERQQQEKEEEDEEKEEEEEEEEEEQQASADSDPPENNSNTAGKGPVSCGVCERMTSKYKCPRCRLPYCSVACSKVHHANHPPNSKPELAREPPSELAATPAADPNPFQALDNSEALGWLFQKYPNLPQQLIEIHSATQPSTEHPSKRIPDSIMRGVPRRSDWDREKGISRGKAALRKARLLPGDDGEAVREYCTLIRLLLEEEGKGSARAVLQQKFAQEDADIIRQLMKEEDKRF